MRNKGENAALGSAQLMEQVDPAPIEPIQHVKDKAWSFAASQLESSTKCWIALLLASEAHLPKL